MFIWIMFKSRAMFNLQYIITYYYHVRHPLTQILPCWSFSSFHVETCQGTKRATALI